VSLEQVGRAFSNPSFFFLHFSLFFFLTELLGLGKAECALLIEERRRKPLRSLVSLGFWLLAWGVGTPESRLDVIFGRT
jgi:hypothetical protein